MIRVVLDTNILISAVLSPEGPPAQIFLLTVMEPDTQLCVSGDVFAEYEEVVRRAKFRRSDNDIQGALRTIREKGFWVRPIEKLTVCSDADDNIFLECAQTANAHYLVTGNVKDFPASWRGTRILTPRQFLDTAV